MNSQGLIDTARALVASLHADPFLAIVRAGRVPQTGEKPT